jgi:hypothetical protein
MLIIWPPLVYNPHNGYSPPLHLEHDIRHHHTVGNDIRHLTNLVNDLGGIANLH